MNAIFPVLAPAAVTSSSVACTASNSSKASRTTVTTTVTAHTTAVATVTNSPHRPKCSSMQQIEYVRDPYLFPELRAREDYWICRPHNV
jgi:hypothetical protein